MHQGPMPPFDLQDDHLRASRGVAEHRVRTRAHPDAGPNEGDESLRMPDNPPGVALAARVALLIRARL